MGKLSKRERMLLIVLAVVIVAVGWFKLIYEPVNDDISALNTKRSAETSENDTNMAQVLKLRNMKTEIEEKKNDPNVKPTPLFDNSKELMIALNNVLMDARGYNLTFGSAEKDSFIVYRNISMDFSADNYWEVRRIIQRLDSETFANQIENMQISIAPDGANVNLSITFFEVVA